ncbi:MAG: hypothetical protein ACYS0G_08645 [Planctomycetota bacterium]|jgi:hypothetical protein
MRPLGINTPFIVSTVAVVVAVAVLLMQLPPLLSTIVTTGLGQDQTVALVAEYMADHEADLETYRKRFDGRSLFFRPQPPRRDRPIARTSPEPPPEPAPAGPPPSYTGPSVLFVLGDEVYFHGGMRLRVGEEDEGVRVVATNPPWSVTLAYRGRDYPIELFKRTFPGLVANPPSSRSTPGLRVVASSDEGALPDGRDGAREQKQ